MKSKTPNRESILEFIAITLDNSITIKEGLKNVIDYLQIMYNNLKEEKPIKVYSKIQWEKASKILNNIKK